MTVPERVAQLAWAIPSPSSDVSLSFLGAEDCDTVGVQWLYDDLAALHEPPEDDDALPYRTDLRSDEGFVFDGSAQPCASVLEAQHLGSVDRGQYALQVAVDGGEPCAIPVTVTGTVDEAQTVEIDLSAPGC